MGVIEVVEGAVAEGWEVRDVVRDFLTKGTAANIGEYWPHDDYVLDALTHGTCARGGSLKAILVGMENHLRAEAGERSVANDKTLDVHWLMPKGREYWEDGDWSIYGRDRNSRSTARSLAVEKIGNVTLVVGKLPPKTKSDPAPWKNKLEFLQNGGIFYMNRELVTRESWDERLIDERTRVLAELASRVWRR